MAVTAHWIYQGRQYHQWFGHGTAPREANEGAAAAPGSLFDPASIGQRIDWAAQSLIAHVLKADRGNSAAVFDDARLDRLKTVINVWYGASQLGRDAFRARLLDPYTSDDTVDRLRSAARGIVEARTHEALNAAGEDLAAAVQEIGLNRWPRYLAGAEQRAVAAVSSGAVLGVTNVSSASTHSEIGKGVGARGGPTIQIDGTPNTGSPNSWYVNPGSGQMRFFGPGGYPALDVDADHDHGMGSPHMHIWTPSLGGGFPIRRPGTAMPPNF